MLCVYRVLRPVAIWIMAVVFSISLFSCHKNNLGEDPVYDFDCLIEFEKVNSYNSLYIQYALTYLSEQYPSVEPLVSTSTYGIDIYKIVYATTYDDSIIEASGLVCIPQANGSFPLVSYQNRTNTLNSEAPSMSPSSEEYLLIELIASNGYVVLLPDYIGFGASSDIVHPYFSKECTYNAIVDIIQAAEELLTIQDIKASNNGDYYLMGYSQGGGATLAILDEIENGSYPGFPVKAASCGSGAYDLYTLAKDYIDQGTLPSATYLPYFIYSQITYGAIQDDLDHFFNEPYASIIPSLFDGTKTNSEIESQLTKSISGLLTSELISGFESGEAFTELRSVMADNSVFAWDTDTPVNIYYGSDDSTIPVSQSSSIYNEFITAIGGAGTDYIKLIEFEGLTHNSASMPWGIATLLWFNEMEGN